MVFSSIQDYLFFYQEVRIYFILVEGTIIEEIDLSFVQSTLDIDLHKIVV